MNIYLQITEQTNLEHLNLTATEKNIMEFIYHNIATINEITVSQISEQCHCSTASIHRFVNKFGCSGYKQFKAEIISGMKVTRFESSKFQLNVNNLIDEIQELDVESFKTNLLKYQGKRIYVYGVGGSFISAQYLARQLNRLDIDAIAYRVADRDGLNELANAVIFISHSGETDVLVEKVKKVQLEKIPTFAITRGASRLSKLVDYPLVHNDLFNADNFNQKESQLATILLIEKIFYNLN